jgi:signal transduction histidine kinase
LKAEDQNGTLANVESFDAIAPVPHYGRGVALLPQMPSLSRYLGLAFVILLLLFLGAALLAQAWLSGQTRVLQADAILSLRSRLTNIVEMHPRSPDLWTEADFNQVSLALGANVRFLQPDEQNKDPGPSFLDYEVPASKLGPDKAPFLLRVKLAQAASSRLALAHERMVFGLLLFLGVPMALLGIAWAVLSLRREAPLDAPSLSSANREMKSLLHLAQASASQSREIESARAERERTEQDLEFNRHLLSNAMEEKIQLGRDLHDGLIQSLYSAGLTLEAARNKLSSSPEEANQGIDHTLAMLNASIKEVRGFIKGLSPEALRGAGFRHALSSLTDELRGGRDVAFDLRIDDESSSMLTLEQSREVLQIAREAVSNALRHGGATSIALFLGTENENIAFLVRDNGGGFDSSQNTGGGHGLKNMEARVARLGGRWSLKSKPGEGTVIRLFLPVLDAKAV